MRPTLARELPHWVLLLGMWAWAALSAPALPERVPVHWDGAGNPDRYGGRFEAVFVGPLIALALYLLLLGAGRLAATRLAHPEMARVFVRVRLGALLLMAGVYAVTQLLVWRVPLGAAAIGLIAGLTGALFLGLGWTILRVDPAVLGQTRQLWRTSPEAQARTQRLAARLLVATGAATLLAAAVAPAHAILVLVGGAVVLAVVTIGHTALARRREVGPQG